MRPHAYNTRIHFGTYSLFSGDRDYIRKKDSVCQMRNRLKQIVIIRYLNSSENKSKHYNLQSSGRIILHSFTHMEIGSIAFICVRLCYLPLVCRVVWTSFTAEACPYGDTLVRNRAKDRESTFLYSYIRRKQCRPRTRHVSPSGSISVGCLGAALAGPTAATFLRPRNRNVTQSRDTNTASCFHTSWYALIKTNMCDP